MKARHVLQVGMLALGLVFAAANGATANHGSSVVGGYCSYELNKVHYAIDGSGTKKTKDQYSMKRKLTHAVGKLNMRKNEDAVEKLQDIVTKVDGLLSSTRKKKINSDGAQYLKDAVYDAIYCIEGL